MSNRSYADAVGSSIPPASSAANRPPLPYRAEWLYARFNSAQIRSSLLAWRRKTVVSLIHIAQPSPGAAKLVRPSDDVQVYLTTTTSSQPVPADTELVRLSLADTSAALPACIVSVCVANVVLRTLDLHRGRNVCIKPVDIVMANCIAQLIPDTAEAPTRRLLSRRFEHIWSHAVRDGADCDADLADDSDDDADDEDDNSSSMDDNSSVDDSVDSSRARSVISTDTDSSNARTAGDPAQQPVDHTGCNQRLHLPFGQIVVVKDTLTGLAYLLLLAFHAGRSSHCVKLEPGIDAFQLLRTWAVHIVHRERRNDLYRKIHYILTGLYSPNVLSLPRSPPPAASRVAEVKAADVSAGPAPAADPALPTAPSSSVSSAHTDRRLGFEQRWCDYRRRRPVLKDSVCRVLKQYPQWAGSALQLRDSHILIDLVCEEGAAREQLEQDIIRQLAADPSDIKWRYVSSRPRVRLDSAASPVCSYMLNCSPLTAGGDPSLSTTTVLSSPLWSSSSSSLSSSGVDVGELRGDEGDASEVIGEYMFEHDHSHRGVLSFVAVQHPSFLPGLPTERRNQLRQHTMEQMVSAFGTNISLLFVSCFHVLCPEHALPAKRSESSAEEHRRFFAAQGMIRSGLRSSQDIRIFIPCAFDGSGRQFKYHSGSFDAFIDIGFSCAERKLEDCTADMRSGKPIFIGTRDDLFDMEEDLSGSEQVVYRTAHGPLTGQLIALRVNVPPDSPSALSIDVAAPQADGLDEGLMFRDHISIRPDGAPTIRGDSGSLVIRSSTGMPFAVHRASRTAIEDAGGHEQLAVSLAETLGWMEEHLSLPETCCWILF